MNDKQIIKKLTEELEQATKSKWVHVGVSLPENETQVICLSSDGSQCEMYFDDDGFIWPRFDFVPDEYDIEFFDSITHWHPMLEPPKQ